MTHPPILPIDQLPFLLRHPFEMIQWEELGHRPPNQVVGVPIHDVTEGLLRVVVAHEGIVRLGMALTFHADPSPHAALNHQIHRQVCDEIQDDISFLQHCIPRHLGCAQIVCWVNLESSLFHAHRSEFLEYVGEDEYVNYTKVDTALSKF